ncbi:MAG: GYD domain-containing protein [Myxococcales bacterium]
MPVYISLLRFTQQGVEAVKEQGFRIDRIKEAYRAAGGELIAYYATLGQYDGIAIYRMQDDAAAAAFCLAIMSKGNVRSETMRAFDEAEYREILASLPS